MRFKYNVAILFLAGLAFVGARAQTITSFSPAFGMVSEEITIKGTGFYYNGGISYVRFGELYAAGTIISDTTLKATVPSGAVSGLISVLRIGQSWVYHPQTFTVIGAGPYVTGFTGSGTPVAIDGIHFTGATAVRFNGTNAASFFAGSDTRITQVYPQANVSTGPITVVTPQGSFTTATNYFVPPVITGFAPANGRAGTNVVLTGKNFLGTTAVYIGGLPAGFVAPTNNTTLVLTVPSNAVNGVIRVDAPAGTHLTTSNFVVQPTLTGFTPDHGPVGTTVTLSGANFNVGTPVVRFNGVQAAAPTEVTSSQLKAVVPAGAMTGPISVTTTDGAHTNAANFYLPARITGFTPNKGKPGDAILVNGNNFLGASAVSFNEVAAAPPTVFSNTAMQVFVPSGATTGPLSVTTPAGSTNSDALFYLAPSIYGFVPNIGRPGTNVVLTGANFLGATAVYFNGTVAGFTPPTNNATLVATVPNNAQTGPITVVTLGGTNTSAVDFTVDYLANLLVRVTDSPDPVTVGSNLVYTVTVQNLGPWATRDIVLNHTLPASVILKSATTTQGSLNTNVNPVIGMLGSLAANYTATARFTVVPQETGGLTTTATATSAFTDPDPANNVASATTFVEPPALLSIRRTPPDKVRVSWPSLLTNFALEYNLTLGTNDAWSNILTTPVFQNNEQVVIETNTAPARFYRLRR